jgi:cobalt-zinc-cadmium efflux system outer membrane protein
MKWFIGGALIAALMPAHVVVAEPVGYAEALRAARNDQPLLRAGEMRISGAREASEASDELPDPILRGGVANLPVTGPVAFELDRQLPTQLSIGIDQQIPNLARRRARQGVALSDVRLAETRLGMAQRSVDVSTSMAWMQLYFAQERLAVAETALIELRALVPVANSAVASGSARPAESLAIRRELIGMEDVITRIEAERDTAKAMLSSYTDIADPVAQGSPPIAEIDAAGLRNLLEQNPEILFADAATELAEAGADLARSNLRPDFGVSVNYGRRDTGFGDAVSVMGSVTLPIFAGSRQEPRIRAAEAEAGAAFAERDERLRALRVQLETDLAAWRSAFRQWERARDQLLPLARDRAELETASFAAGRADLVDVIAAKAALALLELEILERKAAAAEKAVKLRLTYAEVRP